MWWQSWDAFWAMGGYGAYVWGSLGACALLMLAEVWQARAARREVLQQLCLERQLDHDMDAQVQQAQSGSKDGWQ